MGSFYTNITVKGSDQLSIARELHSLGRVAIITETEDGMTVVYDQGSELQDGSGCSLAEHLSKELNCVALFVTNHDDSVLYLHLYRGGELLDAYNSCPNYFDGDAVPPSGGDAEVMCGTFGVPGAVQKVGEVLRFDRHATRQMPDDRFVFEIDRHMELAKTLGLPLITVGTGYTYLADGEYPDGFDPDRVLSVVGNADA